MTIVHLRDAKKLWAEFREALPYIRHFHGKTMVVKVGGSVLHEPTSQDAFLEDVIFMAEIGIRVVLVHGGSRDLNERMRRAGIEPDLRNGERRTDAATLQLAIEVFNELNADLVAAIKALGGKAVGFRAGASSIIQAVRKGSDPENFVGTVASTDVGPLDALRDEYIPVLTCIGIDENGQCFNINADEVANRVAQELHATKLILLTDRDGVEDANGALISTLTLTDAQRLIRNGTIAGGMIPKVKMCLDTIRRGTQKAHIINGSTEGSLLVEVLSDEGVGTEIVMGGRRAKSAGTTTRSRAARR